MVAVLVVSGVGSIVDFRKEVEFVKRRNESDAKKAVNVIRNGAEEKPMSYNDLLVGDLIKIEYGMNIPVDGIVLSGNQISCDESAMTGESEEIRKGTF